MDLLILSTLYHYNSMNLFKVLFALEAKFYFRNLCWRTGQMLQTCLYPAAECVQKSLM